MQLRTRTWALISLACFALAAYFWDLGERRARRNAPPPAESKIQLPVPLKELGALNYARSAPLLSSLTNPPAGTNAVAARGALLTNRLSNTTAPLDTLIRDDHAILLRNALYDTSLGGLPAIPADLKAGADPGAYVVQARGPMNDAFRAQLQAAGATIVSYIPNNAYLVRASAEAAGRLRAAPPTQAVLAWEPYYKLSLPLLALALEAKPLPPNERLRVVVFPGESQAGRAALEALGAEILATDRSPFGEQLIIQPAANSLAPIARLPMVQDIEPHRGRQLANDLIRWRAGIATNTVTTNNHLGLTGEGVLVNINDSAVDDKHPDLTGRVFGLALNSDPSGHGTHVAGIIAGDGSKSSTLNTVSNTPPGSLTNAHFRGVAPAAKLYALPVDLALGPVLSDEYLQETAALTNAFISNNSWNYRDLYEYDSAAASYDAAVRDALPGVTGPQPMLFVFAAGNSGGGSSDGTGGSPETILSPGTAKNVITVGAIESPREITNVVVYPQGTNSWITNQAFLPRTDSSEQVASFSSRGNVGVNVEGTFGRVKPDVVAPGTFIVSCRSSDYEDETVSANASVNRIPNQVVPFKGTNLYQVTVADNVTTLIIRTLRNRRSPKPFPSLPIYVKKDSPPAAADWRGAGQVAISNITAGTWWYAVGNTNLRRTVNYDLELIMVYTNDSGTYFNVLKELNDRIAPYYRYESGTSQAAPAVSGMLALTKQLFEDSPWNYQRTNSPALLKAMIINGARSVGSSYNLQIQTPINYQGWGVVNLTNTLPNVMGTGAGSETKWPVVLIDQDPTNSLLTGESHVRSIKLNTTARLYPLRVTLTWTDPPGNPVSSLKLVNDLDLIVSNRVSGEIYVGNNFAQGSDFTSSTISSNEQPYDVVNNVENVFINRILDSEYDIIVRAKRVNVNAVTTQTNGVLQDYALVIASGNSRLTNVFTSVSTVTTVAKGYDPAPFVRFLSNSVPVMNERVGANSPLLTPAPNTGVTNQWNFYIFENVTNSSLTNVAIITFLPPNLSRARNRDADIDLYVTTDPALTNLDAAAIAGARVSRSRGGTELVYYINAPVPTTYYVGVKSEDQQAATYSIMAIATDKPFGQRDANGNIPLTFFFTPPMFIPDGTPDAPQGTNVLAIVIEPETLIRRIVLTNYVTHELGGDLLGALANDRQYVVLNNHREFFAADGRQMWIFDDSGEDDVTDSEPSDGPGTLRDFNGTSAFGVWQYTIIDNQPNHIGWLDGVSGIIEPDDSTNGLTDGMLLTIKGHHWKYATVNVPIGVTNMIVYLKPENPSDKDMDLYIRRGERPSVSEYDKYATIAAPGGSLALSIYDDPPLQPGRYVIGVSNINDVSVTVRLRVEFQYGLKVLETAQYVSSGDSMPLLDDAITNSTIMVTNNRAIADVRVGVRIDHPRLSDLVLHLVSPSGTRILLSENRGGLLANDPLAPSSLSAVTNFGFGSPVTNAYSVGVDGVDKEFRTNFYTATRSGVIHVTGDFQGMPDTLHVYYEGNRIFDSGYHSGAVDFAIPYGPGFSANITFVVNEGGNWWKPGTKWAIDVVITGPWNYANFTDNPNLGGVIKFAPPPFYSPVVDQILQNHDFEGLVPPASSMITFNQNDTFAGWKVLANGIGVLTDTDTAFLGDSYLALSEGRISLPLKDIQPDHDYILSFAHRRVSSSPAQVAKFDVDRRRNISKFTPYDGLSAPVAVPKLRACPGMKVVITNAGCVYLSQADIDADQCSNPDGDPNDMFNSLSNRCLAGVWSSHPFFLDNSTMASAPFYIGHSNTITAPTAPGDYYLFLGFNDSDFSDNNKPGDLNVTVQWQHCQEASGDYLLGPSVIPFDSNDYWKTEMLRFTANPTTTNLAFRPRLNTTLLLDSIGIFEPVPGAYYLAEEPMSLLQGEAAIGDWKLEIWDNRSGPVTASTNSDAGTLFSWSLNFIFADSTPTVGLTNGIPYKSVARGELTKYFYIAVPNEVTMATNIVIDTTGTGSGLELLYSLTGPPKGETPPDPMGPQASPLELSLTAPLGAELPRGGHYFLGVRNVDPTDTNAFEITVNFNFPITYMSNGVVYPGMLPPNPFDYSIQRDNPSASITNMDFYYFDIPSNKIVSAVFELQSPTSGTVNQDLNLVVRRALPVVDLFPHRLHYDYHSTEYGERTNDVIIINSNSVPVQLAPGRWYAGVYNNGPQPADYTISARMDVAPLYTVTDVFVGDINITVDANNALTNFYRFVADQNNAGIVVEIHKFNADVDLIVRRSDLPTLDLHEFNHFELDTTYEPVALRTNIFLPNINATNWFIGIVNQWQHAVRWNALYQVGGGTALGRLYPIFHRYHWKSLRRWRWSCELSLERNASC